MLILKFTQKDIINQAVRSLQAGGLVIYPTETCYGAGVDATNQIAVNKLLRYKSRREGKPLSVAVTDIKMAAKYVKPNSTAKNLYQKFLPGPLTVISRGRQKVAAGVESEMNTLGIRISSYPLVNQIIKKLGRPITATSANVSYKPRPYSIPQLLKCTSKKQQNLIDLFIDAGTLAKRPVSTIVDTTFDDPLILRRTERSVLKGYWIPKRTDLVVKSPQETKNLAKTLCLKHWNSLQKQPLVFLLIGDLGSGKTQFCKGIGEFLQIKTPITSPTYTLEKEYQYDRHNLSGLFLHLDTWRLQNLAELDLLNLPNRLKPKNIIAIEWADRTLEPILKLAKTHHAKVITVQLQTSSELLLTQRQISFRL